MKLVLWYIYSALVCIVFLLGLMYDSYQKVHGL